MLQDPRTDDQIAEDHNRADDFAAKGTVKHFMLRQGFMPSNEADAEEMLRNLIREGEHFRSLVENCEHCFRAAMV